MSAWKIEFESMSVDELWSLHDQIGSVLSARIRAEKRELEKRLAVPNRGAQVGGDPNPSTTSIVKPRRYYPQVLPKYRNPQTSETWSGRGKRPRWLVAAIKSGRKMEEFRISGGNSKTRQRA